jgi:hypothetical protein
MPTPHTTFRQRYYIRRRDDGAASVFYDAKDLVTRADVTLRYTPWPSDGTAYESFERLAHALRVARHPSLPLVLDAFADEGGGYLVLERERGEPLGVGPHAEAELRRWAAQLLDALDYLQTFQPPVAHGAVIQQNLALRPGGHIALRDYGPDVLREDGDTQADLRQLAATLYELAAGSSLPSNEARREVLARGEADPVGVVEPYGAMLAAALPLDSSSQPPSAFEMYKELVAPADPVTPAPQVAPPEPRHAASPPQSAPPIETTPRGWLRPVVLVTSVAAVLLLLLALLSNILSETSPAAGQETPAPTVTTPASPAPTPTAPPATTSPATVAPEPPTATAVAPPTAATPAASPPDPYPRVDAITPQQVFAGTLPFTLTVSGADLAGVQAARLVANGRDPIGLTVAAADERLLTLRTDPAVQAPVGEAPYRLELDGRVLDSPAVTVRDFLARTRVKGILAGNIASGRIREAQGVLLTDLLSEPRLASDVVGTLQADDTVEILNAGQVGWYRVRISASADSAQIGRSGWIESWVVDGEPVPTPAATPTLAVTPTNSPFAFVGRLVKVEVDAAVQCGTSFQSAVYGSVEHSSGKGIAEAVMRVTSADGRSTFDVRTRSDGTYTVPGLGCTTWIVRLVSIPEPAGVQGNTVTVRGLNGGQHSAAEVRFRLQR